MGKKLIAALGAGVAALSLIAAGVLPAGAQDPPPPIAVELLTPRSEFTDRIDLRIGYILADAAGNKRNVQVKDASRTVTARFTVQPGAQFPWHKHPGPVFVNVTQGELIYVRAKDCIERPYPMGTAFLDPGDRVHTAFNPTDGVTVIVATFFAVPETGPLSITEGIVPPDDCPFGGGPHNH